MGNFDGVLSKPIGRYLGSELENDYLRGVPTTTNGVLRLDNWTLILNIIDKILHISWSKKEM